MVQVKIILIKSEQTIGTVRLVQREYQFYQINEIGISEYYLQLYLIIALKRFC